MNSTMGSSFKVIFAEKKYLPVNSTQDSHKKRKCASASFSVQSKRALKFKNKGNWGKKTKNQKKNEKEKKKIEF